VTDLRGRVGARLKQLRRARRLTQEQLAERAGLSYKFVGQVERGEGNPTLTTLEALSAALGVGADDLLASEPERPRVMSRQALQVREALTSLETFVDLVLPQDAAPRGKRRR